MVEIESANLGGSGGDVDGANGVVVERNGELHRSTRPRLGGGYVQGLAITTTTNQHPLSRLLSKIGV